MAKIEMDQLPNNSPFMVFKSKIEKFPFAYDEACHYRSFITG